jgi:reductive dehalogenase
MDKELSKVVPSAIGGASTGMGYMNSISCANALTQFILNLGYDAQASLNDSALAIPLAIQAGLGEYGRNGLLITKEFGPRVRISKVFTDLPLAIDYPIEFGVEKFCNTCNKCANACPVKAIPHGEPQSIPPNVSSLQHIRKWTINAEKCFSFWANMNTDCAICIRVCPYNKDYNKWWNRLGIRLAGSFLRKFMLWLDERLGYGKRKRPSSWWI